MGGGNGGVATATAWGHLRARATSSYWRTRLGVKVDQRSAVSVLPKVAMVPTH
jgi:hypothetical protein